MSTVELLVIMSVLTGVLAALYFREKMETLLKLLFDLISAKLKKIE